jgi:hypothetical protein
MPTLTGSKGSNVPTSPPMGLASPALEWMWKQMPEVDRPAALCCGTIRQSTLNVFLQRGIKAFLGNAVGHLLSNEKMLWEGTGKEASFKPNLLLDLLPQVKAGSLSVVLTWQLFDLLPRDPLPEVFSHLCSLLMPGGFMLCILREPYLNKGRNAQWWLESPLTLGVGGEDAGEFVYPSLTNREIERLAHPSTIKTFLTRTGRREILVCK